jgi:hypothetical protein
MLILCAPLMEEYWVVENGRSYGGKKAVRLLTALQTMPRSCQRTNYGAQASTSIFLCGSR